MKMKKNPFTAIVFLCLTVINGANLLAGVDIDVAKGKDEISLDGDWLFLPVNNQVNMGGSSIELIDEFAKKLQEIKFVEKQKWYTINVPQFLNHIKWWLSNVSPEYENQEESRISSFGFDAKNINEGWYLKNIKISKNDKYEPNVYINFEGIATVSRIYCNGHYVGGHLGMFGEQKYYLTPYIKWGEENKILVFVQRGKQSENGGEVVSVAVTVPITRDMLTSLNSGMFGGFGSGPRAKFMGIWQPVTLKVSKYGSRIKDVFFKPKLSGHTIDITVENPVERTVKSKIKYTIKDVKDESILCSGDSEEFTLENNKEEFIKLSKNNISPKLWTPDTPNLYELRINLIDKNNKIVDTWTHKIGYRTVKIRGRHVYLNGKKYWCRGANIPPYGYKPNDKKTARGFLQKMKDGNTVITRSHCNPFNRMWFDLCDEIGIGVSCEGVRPWALTGKQLPPKAILEHWKKEQLETVQQYKNHPSILFYCVSNEGLQGDHSPEKLEIFKDIIDGVREIDPTRPVFQTSGEPDTAKNADIEDIHSYWGWYESSSFVNDYSKPMRGLTLGNDRAFMNQECAVPYQNTDTGGVHPTYIGLYSAHPWVGETGVYGDPKYFSKHVAMEGKLKAEKLRYQRKVIPTAGVMLFSNVTWIQHALSRPVSEWIPFPVWEEVKESFEPVMVAWETPQRFFYSGDEISTKIYVVNDDINFSDLKNLELSVEILNSKNQLLMSKVQKLNDVDYFSVEDWPLKIKMPAINNAVVVNAEIKFTLSANSEKVSKNSYSIKIADYKWSAKSSKDMLIGVSGCNEEINGFLKKSNLKICSLKSLSKKEADAVILGPGAKPNDKKIALEKLKSGGRIIILEQKTNARHFCPEALKINTDWEDTADYKIVNGGLKNGCIWSTDREYTLDKTPEKLKGSDYIIVRMNDKKSDSNNSFLRLHLNKNAGIIIGYDGRCKKLPCWLKEFTNTGESITIENNCKLMLYKKMFPAGYVVLNGNSAPYTTAMYTIIIDGESNVLDKIEKIKSKKGLTKTVTGEFVEILDWKEKQNEYDGLSPMDWKWWMLGNGQPAYVCSATHFIDINDKNITPIGRYLSPHFYWQGDLKKVYESNLTYPVFAVKKSWGVLIVCELNISDAIQHDPRAGKTLINLLEKKF